jgi:hyperosmotically inducible protein
MIEGPDCPTPRTTRSVSKEKLTTMKTNLLSAILLGALALGSLSGCSDNAQNSADVTGDIRKSLEQAGLKDVSVKQDRDKGVVTLTGTTESEEEKLQAESIARSIATTQVVADQIAVRPSGEEGIARKVDSDLDKGIEKNFDAVLVKHKLDDRVKYDVKNGVITLKGNVNSQSRRATVEKLAAAVPNVKQVVNELEVRNQKATSSSSD